MFTKMRRKDRTASAEVLKDILLNSEYGTLATIGDDGYPYSVPLNYVYLNEAIYFHSAKTGKKMDNINFNNRVSFSMVLSSELVPQEFSANFKSAVAFGKTAVVEGEEKKAALLELVRKYAPEFYEQGKTYIDRAIDSTTILKITVENLTGKDKV